MKLEWGRKICCPACSTHFYDLQKMSLVCPSCGNTFERSDLFAKKNSQAIIDETIDVDDDKGIADFGFEEDTAEELSVNSDELSVKSEMEDIQLVDEE
ncbi:MAG: FYDLN acid domain-containing protein [Holosporales bacterium]|jgi:uncharacterized protein (TIGR02300 family)|nr:FYDLN acid domain-containing protein [Holosporales bacterium]